MAKITQQKDKDFDAIEPRVAFNDMVEERRLACIEICRDAYSKFLLHRIRHSNKIYFFDLFPSEYMLICAWVSIEMQHDGELKYLKDMALYVKHEMEKKFQGSWHVVVGKSNF